MPRNALSDLSAGVEARNALPENARRVALRENITRAKRFLADSKGETTHTRQIRSTLKIWEQRLKELEKLK